MEAKVGELVPRLKVRCTEELLVAGVFAVDTVLLAENEETVQRMVDDFDMAGKRQKAERKCWKEYGCGI